MKKSVIILTRKSNVRFLETKLFLAYGFQREEVIFNFSILRVKRDNHSQHLTLKSRLLYNKFLFSGNKISNLKKIQEMISECYIAFPSP